MRSCGVCQSLCLGCVRWLQPRGVCLRDRSTTSAGAQASPWGDALAPQRSVSAGGVAAPEPQCSAAASLSTELVSIILPTNSYPLFTPSGRLCERPPKVSPARAAAAAECMSPPDAQRPIFDS